MLLEVRTPSINGSETRMNLVITISGLHGTGKSTFARSISKSFGLRHVSAGDLFRQIADERGLTVSELSKLSSKNRKIDDIIDERTKREARRGSVLLDGLLAGWMARKEADLKLFLTASEKVRIQRIARREGISFNAARRATLLREKLEKRRFNRFYGIDINNTAIYDLTLNTGLLSVKANIDVIETFVGKYVTAYRRK